jgi:acetyltransferase-like isoleucine patch superfamily enzyme
MSQEKMMIVEGERNATEFEEMAFPPRKIEIKGNGNRLKLHPSANLSGFSIFIRGDNNVISVGRNCRLRGLANIIGKKSALVVMRDTTTETVRFSIGGRSKISIGIDCQLSRNIEIRCTDEHPIYDLDTREEINAARDVSIGDHVWIGEGVRVVKGVMIASGSIIGTGSMVTKSLTEANAIYAGSPARKVRSRVAWSRKPGSMDWETADFTNSSGVS